MQQNVGSSGRIDAECCANYARTRHCRFDQIVLKVVVEKVRGAHRKKAGVFVDLFFTERPEHLRHEQQLVNVSRPEGCRIRRRAQQSFSYELGITPQVRLKAMHRVGVMRRVPF